METAPTDLAYNPADGYLYGISEADGLVRIEQKNKFSVGETVEIMKPDGRNLEKEVAAICDEEGNPVESAPHPKQVLYVDLGADAECGDIIRRSEMEAD